MLAIADEKPQFAAVTSITPSHQNGITRPRTLADIDATDF
jgi:hypothetical protein